MEYAYIWAWHKSTGSYDYYINNLIERAKADGAPATAVYYDNWSKRWVCLEEACEATQVRIKKYVEQNT